MGTLCLQLEGGVGGAGGREGSFDINRGTGKKKKKSLSAQDAIFLSISIICFG